MKSKSIEIGEITKAYGRWVWVFTYCGQFIKEEKLKNNFENICKLLPESDRRYLQTAAEKGASAWLAVLPLQSLGYSLNKREFQDAIRLRYGWNIPDMPRHCGCGKLNSVNHSLDCKLGGYTHIRHNKIRDTEARIMQEVAFDVKTEPGLQTLSRNINLTPGTKTEDNARLDISARGIFSSHELTFFDVRITNPNAPSNRSLTLSGVYNLLLYSLTWHNDLIVWQFYTYWYNLNWIQTKFTMIWLILTQL